MTTWKRYVELFPNIVMYWDRNHLKYVNSPFLTYFLFCNDFKDIYDRIWIIEYDVFTLDWNEFFTKYESNQSKLIINSNKNTYGVENIKANTHICQTITCDLWKIIHNNATWSLLCMCRLDKSIFKNCCEFTNNLPKSLRNRLHGEVLIPTITRMYCGNISVFPSMFTAIDVKSIINSLLHYPLKDIVYHPIKLNINTKEIVENYNHSKSFKFL